METDAPVVPDWRAGLVLLAASIGALLVGGDTCSAAIPVCTGLAWAVLWALGALGLIGLGVLQATHRRWGQALVSLLFLAVAVAHPIWEAITR
ncbi:MAG: hypothetical protein JXB39_03130 [Deltaproteobacteria bacterium]|nr:hypothetical protein [Deltaproteobacteria bacterium]